MLLSVFTVTIFAKVVTGLTGNNFCKIVTRPTVPTFAKVVFGIFDVSYMYVGTVLQMPFF